MSNEIVPTRGGQRASPGQTAVSEDGNRVGQAKNLLQAVAHIKDGAAVIPELKEASKKFFDLPAGKTACWLIQNKNRGTSSKRRGNSKKLAVGRAQQGSRQSWIKIATQGE
jgi:hypothetical protein